MKNEMLQQLRAQQILEEQRKQKIEQEKQRLLKLQLETK